MSISSDVCGFVQVNLYHSVFTGFSLKQIWPFEFCERGWGSGRPTCC